MDLPEGIDRSRQKLIVGVISDTHVNGPSADPPRALVEAFAGSDLILHAGDIGSHAVIAALRQIAPVIAVRGNEASDGAPSMGQLPRCRKLEIGGRKIVLTHGDLGRTRDHPAARWDRAAWRVLKRGLDRPGVREVVNGFVLVRLAVQFQGRADCVVFGHTHIPTVSRLGPTLYVNPGDARYCTQPLVHIAMLHIQPGKPIRAELVALDLSRPRPVGNSQPARGG